MLKGLFTHRIPELDLDSGICGCTGPGLAWLVDIKNRH